MPKDKIVDVSAACAATTCTSKKSGSAVQPVAVVGVDFVSFFNCPRKDPPTWGGSIDVVRIMNDANQASNCESGSLDIMKVSQDPSLACSSSHDEYSRGRSAFLVLYDLYPSETFVDCEDDDGENSGESYGSPTHSMSGASAAAGAETGTSGFVGSGNGSGSHSVGEKKQEKSVTTHAGGNVKKYVSGTGTSASSSSGTRQENMYQDLFLPKFLYGPPIVQDGEGSVIISTAGADPLENLDFSPPSSVLPVLSPDYALNMLQVTLANSHPGTTINHMKKIITKKCVPAPPPIIAQEPPKSKPFEPVVGQVVRMPEGYRIHSIHPTKDGGHLLVVLVYKFLGDPSCDDATAMDVDEEEDFDGMEPTAPCRLLLFPLYLEDDVIRICEIPKVYTKFSNSGEIPVEVSLLPLQERDDRSDPDETESVGILAKQSHGLATLICANGNLRVLELNSLSIVAEATPPSGSKFISATFCNSELWFIFMFQSKLMVHFVDLNFIQCLVILTDLERICACTETGSLHFFPLQWNKEISHNPSPVYSQPSTSQSVPLDFTATYR